MSCWLTAVKAEPARSPCRAGRQAGRLDRGSLSVGCGYGWAPPRSHSRAAGGVCPSGLTSHALLTPSNYHPHRILTLDPSTGRLRCLSPSAAWMTNVALTPASHALCFPLAPPSTWMAQHCLCLLVLSSLPRWMSCLSVLGSTPLLCKLGIFSMLKNSRCRSQPTLLKVLKGLSSSTVKACMDSFNTNM